jgi:IS5 family transposase
MVRIDSTVTAALMNEQSDSALLWGAVRVMSRLLHQAAKRPGAPAICWHDRRRLARRCAVDIPYRRGQDGRRRLYRKLVAATDATRAALQWAAERLTGMAGLAAIRWRAQVARYLPLIARVLDQSEPRVLHGQAVPARKSWSASSSRTPTSSSKAPATVRPQAQPHTGKSGLILHLVIETVNTADAERFLPILDRYIAPCGTPPRQVAADRSYARRYNIDQAKSAVSPMSPFRGRLPAHPQWRQGYAGLLRRFGSLEKSVLDNFRVLVFTG